MADGNSNSIINLGGLTKPATVLIEKVSNAVGVLYEPCRIRKKAKAEAEAEKIKVLASIELNEIQQRAIDRLVHQEERKQENIESITAKAAQNLKENAEVENLEEDWVAHFFKQCDTVSDKEMQSLWSSLLSGEASKPGTFSKRTVDCVASMDKKDAKLFTEFCQFCILDGEMLPFIFDVESEIFTKKGITFSSLKHLDSIGLISFEPVSGYIRKGFPKYAKLYYFEMPISIEFNKDDGNKIETGKVLLTQVGQELAPICGAERNEEFYFYVIEKLFNSGYVLSTDLPNK
ncbi:DUF2806 domain-containing protein [Francisella tularensis]|uniref:DUF2806 domain-containing protein n=1 Tax=Francisella tularensis TaxID=263 RepID=UPI001F1C7DCC|nr:DUF2806 domain-containing protein [Francisella tularensis]MBK2110393.1 DUF2806 domain-containing protein [Francisella tularensis subsp. novicida FSC595]